MATRGSRRLARLGETPSPPTGLGTSVQPSKGLASLDGPRHGSSGAGSKTSEATGGPPACRRVGPPVGGAGSGQPPSWTPLSEFRCYFKLSATSREPTQLSSDCTFTSSDLLRRIARSCMS